MELVTHAHYLHLELQDAGDAVEEEKKQSKRVVTKIAKRQAGQKLDPHLEDQFASGRLLACISSRPGQCGRSDGYVALRFSHMLHLPFDV